MCETMRIARNICFLYFRMILVMIAGFFVSLVVLQALGVEDYGLSDLIGVAVGMPGFLNGCAAGTTSRVLTFSLGQLYAYMGILF